MGRAKNKKVITRFLATSKLSREDWYYLLFPKVFCVRSNKEKLQHLIKPTLA